MQNHGHPIDMLPWSISTSPTLFELLKTPHLHCFTSKITLATLHSSLCLMSCTCWRPCCDSLSSKMSSLGVWVFTLGSPHLTLHLHPVPIPNTCPCISKVVFSPCEHPTLPPAVPFHHPWMASPLPATFFLHLIPILDPTLSSPDEIICRLGLLNCFVWKVCLPARLKSIPGAETTIYI